VIEAGATVQVPVEISVHRQGKFERHYDLFFTDGQTLWPVELCINGTALDARQSETAAATSRRS
jgi:hypothetical protein